MPKPIAIFYHAAFFKDAKTPWPMGIPIVWEQWEHMRSSGLIDEAKEIVIGLNGGSESSAAAESCFLRKGKIIYHGLESKAENLTIVALHEWAKTHPGWAILYLHSKGISHAPGSHYGESVSGPWRRGMMKHLVGNWRECVADLDSHDIACARWLWNMADGSQHIPAGNFLWLTSDFAAKLPSFYERERIKQDGISALSSRFEAEVFWGNGPRPNVKTYLQASGDGIP